MDDFLKAVQGGTVALGNSNADKAVGLMKEGKLQECLNLAQEDHTL